MTALSAAQRGMWAAEQAGVAGTTYHLAVAVWLDGYPVSAALERACADVVAAHPMLRAAVVDEGNGPRLVPVPAAPVRHRRLIDTLLDEEVRRPFDLERGPLARFVLATDPARPDRTLLLAIAHHLVFDGMSKDVLVRALARAYAAALVGSGHNPHNPHDLEWSVVERYLRDQDAAVEAGRDDAGLFWPQQLRPPDDVVLPGLSRVPLAAEPGRSIELTLDAATSARLQHTAQRLEVTRFELLFTLLDGLLRRYGTIAPVIAVDLSTRTPRDADAIGSFVNELPVTIAGTATTFAQHAVAVRAQLRGVYQHRRVPLNAIIHGLVPRPALAAVSVSYRRQPVVPAFTGLGTGVDWMVHAGAARNALHVQIVDGPAAVRLSLRHSPAALEADAADRIAEHLLLALDAVLADPDIALVGLPVLTRAETDLVLRRWNDTDRAFPPSTMDELFAVQVDRTPDAAALSWPGDAGSPPATMTYRQLDSAVDDLGACLRTHGIGPGDRVAVAIPRSPRQLVALLAVGRIGAAYVPVDPTYPPARRALILDTAAPALIMTTTAGDEAGSPWPVLVLDESHRCEASGDRAVHPGRDGDHDPDVAYVMFTSGSTGRPKGVVVTRSALANLLLGMAEILGSGPGDVWLASTSVAFDISAVELYLPLVTGGRVVLAPEAPLTADGRPGRCGAQAVEHVRYIRSYGITHVQATPSGWQLLLAAGFGVAGAARSVVALTGGETLAPALARDLRGRVGRLINLYGPTETTVWSTYDEIGDEVTIGRPLPNTQAYVLDRAGRPLPVGVPGELYLGGRGVARGYVGDDSLTAERFVADPFRGHGRLYRTGDRVTQRPDGRFVFLGRSDTQVKIRGHRVELAEIEALLLEHPAVAMAAVTVLDDDAVASLTAYIVPRTAIVDTRGLRDELARMLPEAMLPDAWLILDQIAMTPNGKVDRSSLPRPVRRQVVESTWTSGDPVMDGLRVIFAEVLGVDTVRPDDDLFELGGHSLSVVRMIELIRQRLDATVPLEAFFDTPTIIGIERAVRARQVTR